MTGLRGVVAAVSTQLGEQLLVGAVVARGNQDEGHDTAARIVIVGQTAQCIDEDVDAFVAVFVAAADGHQDAVGRHCFVRHGRSHFEEFLAGILAGLLVVRRIGRDAVFKAVRGDDITFASQELAALACRDGAHGREDVGRLGRGLLE